MKAVAAGPGRLGAPGEAMPAEERRKGDFARLAARRDNPFGARDVLAARFPWLRTARPSCDNAAIEFL